MDLTRRHVALMAGPTAVGFAAVLVAHPPAVVATGGALATVSTTARVTTATGTAEYTPWGDLQVRITIFDRRITKVAFPMLPKSPVSAFSTPTLAREAISAQSAHIHAVSGATYTSSTFVESLQSALAAAHLPAMNAVSRTSAEVVSAPPLGRHHAGA